MILAVTGSKGIPLIAILNVVLKLTLMPISGSEPHLGLTLIIPIYVICSWHTDSHPLNPGNDQISPHTHSR